MRDVIGARFVARGGEILSLVLIVTGGCSSRELPTIDEAPADAAVDAAIPQYGCDVEFCTFEEECDGIDSDLDGIVDESDLGMPLSEFCTADCGQGARTCIGGVWGECVGPTPLAEVGSFACDGIDNDCNGRIDEQPFEGGDVLVLLDISGSMGTYLRQVLQQLAEITAERPAWRFALAVFPIASGSDVLLVADFGQTMPDLSIVGTYTEPSWDALAEAATDELGASWRPGAARFVVVVTDEPGQSYTHPPITERIACAKFHRGETVIAFANVQDDFDECGSTYRITELGTLADVLADPCAAP